MSFALVGEWPGEREPVGFDGLFGLPGSDIPVAGDNGASPLANDGIGTADRYVWQITSPPATCTVEVDDAGRFGITGATGTVTIGYTVWILRAATGLVEQQDNTITIADSAGGTLAGQATAQASASGYITIGVPLLGASLAEAAAAGSAQVSKPLAGSATVVASASGAVSLVVSLSGAAIAQAQSSASFGALVQLDGAAASVAGMSGSLVLNVPLSAAAVAEAQAAGGLTLSVPLAGLAAGSGGASAAMLVPAAVTLAGGAQAVSLAQASLVVASMLLGAASSRYVVRPALRRFTARSVPRLWRVCA